MKKPDSVQALYTERAPLYDRLFIDFLGWGKELQRFFARSDYLHPNSKMLDAGCGTGIITRVLWHLAAERQGSGITFHAFDLTESMLHVFRSWIEGQGAENIEIRQADALTLDGLPDHWRGYDLIVSSTMLEYLPPERITDALTNLARLLTPDGTLLVFVTRRTLLTRWIAKTWWKTNVYSEDEIIQRFREVGFAKVASHRLSAGWADSIMVIEARR